MNFLILELKSLSMSAKGELMRREHSCYRLRHQPTHSGAGKASSLTLKFNRGFWVCHCMWFVFLHLCETCTYQEDSCGGLQSQFLWCQFWFRKGDETYSPHVDSRKILRERWLQPQEMIQNFWLTDSTDTVGYARLRLTMGDNNWEKFQVEVWRVANVRVGIICVRQVHNFDTRLGLTTKKPETWSMLKIKTKRSIASSCILSHLYIDTSTWLYIII